MENNLEKKYRPYVIIASIVIPVVVAALFGIKIEGVDTSFLPPIYASINGLTGIILVVAVVYIKKGKREQHQRLMSLAMICSLLFLVGYVIYHITSDATIYGDLDGDGLVPMEDFEKIKLSAYIYYSILASHILLSIAVIPLVLFTYLKGWAGNVESHRKWAKFTFPIWLYVAISGVIVYVMISPYY